MKSSDDRPGPPQARAGRRSIGLDLARCAAVSLVVLAHIGQTTGSPLGAFVGIRSLYYVSLGGLGVTVFLVISGWALELRYGGVRLGYARFVTRRALRVYPVYYLAVIVALLLFPIADLLQGRASLWPSLHALDVFLTLTGTYAFAGRWGGPFLNTSWFIGLIFVLYLVFPWLSRAISARPALTMAALLALSLASRALLGRYGWLPGRPLDWFPPCRVFEFSLGIWLAGAYSRASLRPLSLGRLDPLIIAAAALSFPLFLVHYPLLPLIPRLVARGLNVVPASALFVLVSVALAWLVLVIDRALRRRLPAPLIDSPPRTASTATGQGSRGR